MSLPAVSEKLLEIMAAGSISVATIFFTLLLLLYGNAQTLGASARKDLRPAIFGATLGVVCSVGFAVLSGVALVSKSPTIFMLTVAMAAMLALGVIVSSLLLMQKTR